MDIYYLATHSPRAGASGSPHLSRTRITLHEPCSMLAAIKLDVCMVVLSVQVGMNVHTHRDAWQQVDYIL